MGAPLNMGVQNNTALIKDGVNGGINIIRLSEWPAENPPTLREVLVTKCGVEVDDADYGAFLHPLRKQIPLDTIVQPGMKIYWEAIAEHAIGA